MSSYVVLARKWRPAQFADIVGQNHIVRTLQNAIRSQRIHQAYLFTGSRGIGKTSIARIFSKVLRCEKTQDENGFIRSCDECSSCREITTSSSVDVIEIDGASNNGVEAIREIRENAKYMPSFGSRKVYIIDEVHMLTAAAFNALLKILEEPPAHVIFVFATTEPHKIPATVLSRCQRFDYRRVTVAQIQTRLSEIIEAEGVQAETGALSLIARASEGSMRDALSLLDQVIAFSGSRLSVQSVRESVGLIEGQALLGILSAVFKRKPIEALNIVEQAFQQGHDLRVLTRSLIEFLHGALLAKVGSQATGTLELSADEWKELQALSELRSLEEMELFFQVLHQGMEWIARSPQPKIVLNVLLIKCATAEALVTIEQTLIKTSASVSETSIGINQANPTGSNPAPIENSALKAAFQTPPAPKESIAPVKAPLEKSWENFIDHIRRTRPLLASILEHSSGTTLPAPGGDRCLQIFFSPENGYFREQLMSRVYQEQLSSLCRDYFEGPMRLQIELKNSVETESLAARKEREQKQRIDSIREKAATHPIIVEAKSLFGGELSPIQIRESSHADLST